MNIAIIPARGGSKGLPRKNVRSLKGVPLVAHSIRQAISAQSISEVYVSTDDTEIARVSLDCGAKVIWRPTELSGDTASSESALIHALDYLDKNEGIIPKLVVFLQATSPLRRKDDIDQALETLQQENADSLVSVTPFHRFTWTRGQDSAVAKNYDPMNRPRRQEREAEYLENGSIYIFKPSVLRTTGSRLGGKIALYEMDPFTEYEIDTLDDFAAVEWAYDRMKLGDADRRVLPDDPSAIVFDFDGVMTDNRVLLDQNGTETVSCNRSDGLGISMMRKANIPMLILSTELNPVVSKRADKLQIPCLQGVENKREALECWSRENGYDLASMIYVGNDVNDMGCFQAVGYPVAVGDAVESIKRAARVVLESDGGKGAIRELTDLVLTPVNSFG